MMNTLMVLAIALFVLWIVLVFTVHIPLWAVYLIWIIIVLSVLWWLMGIFRVGWYNRKNRDRRHAL